MTVQTKEIPIETKVIDPSKVSIPDYDESLRYVEVSNLEDSTQPIEFVFNKVVWNSSKRKRGHETMNYKMTHGVVYHLPKFIINHLKSLRTPDPIAVKQPDGSVKTLMRSKYRFGFAEVDKPRGEVSDGRYYKGRKKYDMDSI